MCAPATNSLAPNAIQQRRLTSRNPLDTTERQGIRCTEDVANRQAAILRALRGRLGGEPGRSDQARLAPSGGAVAQLAQAEAPTSRFNSLVAHLNDLERLNESHSRHIDWLRATVAHSSASIRLPTLFGEIFDIQASSRSSSASSSSAPDSCAPASSPSLLDSDCSDGSSSLGFLDGAKLAPRDACGEPTSLQSGAGAASLLEADWPARPLDKRDFFFELDDSDDRIDDEADLEPTVDRLL